MNDVTVFDLTKKLELQERYEQERLIAEKANTQYIINKTAELLGLLEANDRLQSLYHVKKAMDHLQCELDWFEDEYDVGDFTPVFDEDVAFVSQAVRQDGVR